jgi:hypothetical protein
MLVTVQFGPAVQRNLTDRAKRYRAQKNVTGPKKCVLCGSKRDLGVMHLDGDEAHGERKNLAWGCRSCNQILSHAFKRVGAGKRTKQFNPSQGVPTFEQYVWAVRQGPGGTHKGPYLGRGKWAKGPHDEAGAIIHATPKHKRIEYAARIAGLKAERGTGGRDVVPF